MSATKWAGRVAGRRGAIFDAHLHIIDPRFPLRPNRGYVPEAFSVADYRAATAGLGVAGGAVVAGSFQGPDHAYLLDALARLGRGFVGVAELPVDTGDALIRALHGAGVRALRVNLRRGSATDWADLERLIRRAHATAGWHTEVYLDAAALSALEARLAHLPALVIDHLGLERAARPALLRLVERGARVKACGFGRLDFDPALLLRALAAASPTALLFGTDLPGTRCPRPFQPADLQLLADALGDDDLVRAALWDNALALYRPDVPASAAGDVAAQ